MHSRSEGMIIRNWKGTDPLVSVCCLTYNHENFIADALDSFLMQETDFPFEILIHDDASNDKTADVVRSYENGYPAIIKAVYQEVNQYKQGVSPISFIFQKAKGKYIAICEGDDYWRDTHKLQKQFDFMEKNPEYSICYHDSIIIDQSGKQISCSKLKKEHKKDASSFELKTSHKITTQTIFFINIVKDLPREFYMTFGGDKFLCSCLGGYGMGKYMPDVKKSAFRVHSGGINRGVIDIRKKYQNLLKTRISLYEYYNVLGDIECQNYFLKEIHFISLRYLLISFSKLEIVKHLFKMLSMMLFVERSSQIKPE